MKHLSSLVRAIAALSLLAAAPAALAQTTPGVGIGTTAPDASAALDIVSSSKGLLLPRVAAAAAIASPAPGLLVYQTGAPAGFYFNAGTALAPSWQQLATAGTGDNLGNHTATENLNLGTNQLVGNGGSTGISISSVGSVGIGTTATQQLDVNGGILARAHSTISNQGAYLQWNRTGGDGETWLLNQKGGGTSNAGIRFGSATTGNAVTEWARFRDDGNLGIGTTNPGQKLDVNGTVYSRSGGFMFPDNTTQTTAATDAQSLSLIGQNLSISGGNTVTLPAASGDDLGNHTATQNLNLNGNKLVGGTTARAIRGGLKLDGNGLLTVGETRVHPDSTNGYGVRLLDMDQDFIMTSQQYRGKISPLNVQGAGSRVMWLSYYSSFFAGAVTGNRWDYNHVGAYSAVFGLDNEVMGSYSAAFGYNNWVRFGQYNLISGTNNYGLLCDAGLMMGRDNVMRGSNGFCGGYDCKVSSSTSLYAPSFAFGYRSEARASAASDYALGYYARTGGYEGCFVLADFSPYRTSYPDDSLVSTVRNQFSARFAGGYRLYTSAATPTSNPGQGTPVGVQLTAGANAWTVLSDSTQKERIVLADGNRFLERIDRMRLGSWNYKGQSPDTMRHYGPMAQDFYAAFGHDAVGRSGTPTGINQADFDGVNLIAIQALYRQVQELKAVNARQQAQLLQLQARAERAEAAAAAQAQTTATLESLAQRLRALEAGGGAYPGGQARK